MTQGEARMRAMCSWGSLHPRSPSLLQVGGGKNRKASARLDKKNLMFRFVVSRHLRGYSPAVFPGEDKKRILFLSTRLCTSLCMCFCAVYLSNCQRLCTAPVSIPALCTQKCYPSKHFRAASATGGRSSFVISRKTKSWGVFDILYPGTASVRRGCRVRPESCCSMPRRARTQVKGQEHSKCQRLLCKG